MRVSDLKKEDVRPGLRIKARDSERCGTVSGYDEDEPNKCVIVAWDGTTLSSNLYWPESFCLVVTDDNDKPIYVELETKE